MAPDTTKLEAETRKEIDTKLTQAGIPYAIKVTGTKHRQYLMNAEGFLHYIQSYKDRCLKTHIFAKVDDYCDRIYKQVREKFAEQQIWTDGGNAFCKKITYKVGKKTAEESIKAFRTDSSYRMSGDELHTNLVALQRALKGRASWTARDGVTPDAPGKSRFVLVDCVDVTETDKTETKSLVVLIEDYCVRRFSTYGMKSSDPNLIMLDIPNAA